MVLCNPKKIVPKFFGKKLAIAAFSYLFATLPTHAVDLKKAGKLFKKCAACHEIGEGAGHKVGPNLNGLSGRIAGTEEGYKYSKSLKRAGNDGLVWNKETLTKFVRKPRSFVKGSKMSFAGLKKQKDLDVLTEWLLTFTADGVSNLSADDTPIAGDYLGQNAVAMEGDAEFGEYLSGECVTCHQVSGAVDGIPSIVGMPKEHFIHLLYEYKTNLRENPVMNTVSKRLTDEEMAALAAYFGSIEN